jgi:hypothetical protein
VNNPDITCYVICIVEGITDIYICLFGILRLFLGSLSGDLDSLSGGLDSLSSDLDSLSSYLDSLLVI